MRVVVTGGTGNVGTSVVDALLRDDSVDEVVAIARRPVEERPRLRCVVADVGTDDLTPHLRAADAMVHLAWMFQPTHRPETTWRANAVGTGELLDAAATAGVGAVVVASSVGAYSPAPGRRVDESWPTHSLPTAGYGREKANVERLLDACSTRPDEVASRKFRMKSRPEAMSRMPVTPFATWSWRDDAPVISMGVCMSQRPGLRNVPWPSTTPRKRAGRRGL